MEKIGAFLGVAFGKLGVKLTNEMLSAGRRQIGLA
jgi:hypothetical protein